MQACTKLARVLEPHLKKFDCSVESGQDSIFLLKKYDYAFLHRQAITLTARSSSIVKYKMVRTSTQLK